MVDSTIHLKSSGASATIEPLMGATVTSLSFNKKQKNILWQPKNIPEIGSWLGGGIPFCFPFAGRVWHNNEVGKYLFPGGKKPLPMPIHGFAAILPWTVKSSSENSATLELRDSEQTMDTYPFKFKVQLNFVLSEDSLEITANIESLDSSHGVMPVAAGFHPYFQIEENKKNYSGHRLTSSSDSFHDVSSVGSAESMKKFESSPWSKSLEATQLHNLILGPKPDNSLFDVVIQNEKDEHGISIDRMTNREFRHMVLWGKPDLGFFCVEPWMALPDAVHKGGGCIFMKPTQSLELKFRISLLQLTI